MFILHTGEDTQVPPENSLLLYQALHAQGIHAELHIYAEGQHGLDMTNHTSLPVNMEWPGSFTKWLLRLQL
jgi:dipeptidyl aminopeptidase/acylaminoacyl peptidase